MLIYLLFDTVYQDGPDRTLWVTDGTNDGTFPLTEEGSLTERISRTSRYHVPQEVAYFDALSTRGLRSLWKTDGTVSGTELVYENIELRSVDRAASFPGRTFFVTEERDLWITDGTSSGTTKAA